MTRAKKLLYCIGVAVAVAGGAATSPAAAEGRVPGVTPLDEAMPVTTPLDEGHTPLSPPAVSPAREASGQVSSAHATAETDDGVPTDGEVGAAALPCITSTGVTSCFDKAGDKVLVKDTLADGRSAVGLWETNYGRTGGCRNGLGAGVWAECNYDMREEGYIQLQNARYDGDTGAWTYPNPRVYSVWLPIGN
ncbi:hypothetical protein ACFY71_36975 [Streptomyces cinerochromogenes]|uniref:hypothetical protein n=1 Tax=Streptomyces cinerochromogenes TaxID=66422 RepID=UPI0036C9D72A